MPRVKEKMRKTNVLQIKNVRTQETNLEGETDEKRMMKKETSLYEIESKQEKRTLAEISYKNERNKQTIPWKGEVYK